MISNVRSLDGSSMDGGPDGDDLSAAGPAELVFSPHVRPMFRFAVTLSSLEDADDVVQDSLARAWAKRAHFDPARGALRSWLLA